jgi:NADH-quinone oxidoreductase subunit L
MSETTLTTLTWLIPASPLLAFFLILLFFRRNHTLSFLTAWTGIGVALVFSWIVVGHIVGIYWQDYQNKTKELEHHPAVIESSVAWLPVGNYFAPAPNMLAEAHVDTDHAQEADAPGQWLEMGVVVDPLNALMLFMVPFTVLMIFIYSVGYHNYGQPLGMKLGIPNHGKRDPLFSRFFAMMSLFAGAMLLLVVADNLLLFFIGWEIMGFCSYSLIGFWYARTYDDPRKIPPRYASIKAFMTTRVADVIMLLGIVYYYRVFGTLNFAQTMNADALMRAAENPAVGIMGLAIITLLLFTGTDGKSAQWPLHVWLPDAMEGPTPVSAVIHAAAMVSAGIFLLLRIFPLIAVSIHSNPTVGIIIAGIGAFTALMAATMALTQSDVKGVLAFSTISQLGFMVAALGVGAYVAATFHLITHAFFKALLFMGSGSIIHGMEHGAEHVHDHHTDPQDMFKMGGLRQKMPITFITFLIGGFALSGFPFLTAGFWSKDEIFAEAYAAGLEGNFMGWVVFITLSLAAFMTAFYTMRQISLTFLGEPRSPLAEHAHESNGFMTLPLILLSFFAITAGFVGIPSNFLGTEYKSVFVNHFHDFAGAIYHEPLHLLHEAHLVGKGIETPDWSWVPLTTSLVVALGGLFLGWWVYGRKPLQANQPDPLVRFLGQPLYNFLLYRWYWDALYARLFVRPTVVISEVVVPQIMDKGIIDGLLHLTARITFAIGGAMATLERAVFGDGVDWIKDRFLDLAREFRTFQSGKIQEYALLSTVLAWIFAAFILIINFVL